MKCCILAAGLGTRMGSWTDLIHKALLPLGGRAVISRIIEQLPAATEFVIVVGHQKDVIREYFDVAHPGLPVTFVEVDRYEGPGTGPGYSLFAAREHLRGPFLFTACDTLITGPLPEMRGNWVGVVEVDDVRQWCSLAADHSGRVTRLYYKQPAPTRLAFTGIAHVEDAEAFWAGLEDNRRLERGELQVNNGLEALIERGLFVRHVDWLDTGSAAHYGKALALFGENLSFAGKSTDITYRTDAGVIKYFPQPESSRDRFTRGRDHRHVFADVLRHCGHFFSTRFYDGELLSARLSRQSATQFLDWMEREFWRNVVVGPAEWENVLRSFYRDKTRARVADYGRAFGEEPRTLEINGLRCETVADLLDRIPDAFYRDGQPSTFHGDLHDDNVLCTPDGFKLIDWRENFGGMIGWGDRYYDLAKFLHTLHFSVEAMRDRFAATVAGSRVRISHHQAFGAVDALEAFWEFVARRKYDVTRIHILNALVFVNMAPLYSGPIASYLYYLGRYKLQQAIQTA